MRQVNSHIDELPQSGGADEPTIGAIKRALHGLSRGMSASGQRDNGATLREAHDLLRGLATRNGIDPDDAVRQRLAEVQLLRDRMALFSVPGSGQTST